MADKPIPFRPEMIRALLDGRKTMTRRIITKAAALDALSVFDREFLTLPGNADLIMYAPGDRLWVKETWGEACELDDNDMPASEIRTYYRASGEPFSRYLDPDTDIWRDGLKWKPSIHMPRWASRLTLIVESVKVERLQDISEQDAKAEGAEPATIHSYVNEYEGPPLTHKRGFANLWESIHGPGAWEANPWVAAIGFRVIKANIDEVPHE